MGKLHGKDVWHIHYDNGNHFVVLGSAPEGATLRADGKGSASKTIQRIKAKGPFNRFSYKHGAVTANIAATGTKKGANISFSPGRAKNSVKSKGKIGPMYVGKSGGATLISRHPLSGRKRRRRDR